MGVVPVSEALSRLSQDPAFWASVLTGDRFTESRPTLHLSFPVVGGYALVLEADLGGGERALGLRSPASLEPIQLGWTAPGLPLPAALRWWELDLCARVIALEDPTLPHPGLVVALLSPFAPALPEDNGHEITQVRTAAYRSLLRPPPGDEPPDPRREPPLPLFTDAAWWPSPRVLDDATITRYLTADQPHAEVRSGHRFPRADLDRMLRLADRRLAELADNPLFARVRPSARQITESGDLSHVSELVHVLTEAGCDHPTVLDALSEPLVPAEACWMVETLAGAAPGTLLRRCV
ncbi:hypothetical protein [Actinoplanes sp. NPDC089786]|uniref:hypothetical protein n=1 Tax=Actinoplanes sp. NPDC089786 TaxID=3155185 RepID=UPI00341967B5